MHNTIMTIIFVAKVLVSAVLLFVAYFGAVFLKIGVSFFNEDYDIESKSSLLFLLVVGAFLLVLPITLFLMMWL